jgi:hypothetical protein
VLRAERVETKYGVSILLTVRESSVDVVRVYLSKSYTDVFTDPNIASINNGIPRRLRKDKRFTALFLSNDSPCKTWHFFLFCSYVKNKYASRW